MKRILFTLSALAILLPSCTTYREKADGSRQFSTAAQMEGDAWVEVNKGGFIMSADRIDHSAGLKVGRDTAATVGATGVFGKWIDL